MQQDPGAIADALSRKILADIIGAELEHLLFIEVREPKPGEFAICLTAGVDTEHEQYVLLSPEVFDTPGTSPAETAVSHLVVEINSTLAVHLAQHGRNGDGDFVEALNDYRTEILESGILADVPNNILEAIDVKVVLEQIADIIDELMAEYGFHDISVAIGDDEISLDVSATFESAEGVEWQSTVNIPLPILLDLDVYADFKDATDFALSSLVEELAKQVESLRADGAPADLIKAVTACKSEITACELTTALSDRQEQALRDMVDFCAQVSAPQAAMNGLMTAETHEIPIRFFRCLEGVMPAVRKLFEGDEELDTNDPIAFNARLSKKVGRLPPLVAGPLAGFLFADMVRHDVDTKPFRDAIMKAGRAGARLH